MVFYQEVMTWVIYNEVMTLVSNMKYDLDNTNI